MRLKMVILSVNGCLPKTNVKENNYQYRPGIVYRLGEAFLNYAEALNEYKDERTVQRGSFELCE